MFYVSSEKLKPTKNVKGCTHLFVVHTCTVLMTTLAHLHICTWSHLHMITLAHLHMITLALSSWSNIIVIKGVPPLIGTRLARRLGEEWRYCDSPLSIFLSTPPGHQNSPPPQLLLAIIILLSHSPLNPSPHLFPTPTLLAHRSKLARETLELQDMFEVFN